MTLSAASTDQEVWDEYDNCLSYERQNSRQLAMRFIEACTALIRRRPSTAGRGDQTFTFESVKALMDRADRWLAANPDTSKSYGTHTRFSDFTNFRE